MPVSVAFAWWREDPSIWGDKTGSNPKEINGRRGFPDRLLQDRNSDEKGLLVVYGWRRTVLSPLVALGMPGENATG